MKSLLGIVLYLTITWRGIEGLDEDRNARTLSYHFDNTGTGPYSFGFETSNGIKREEQGTLTNPNAENEAIVVKGSYSYTDGTGKVYTVHYTADENGFHPEGDHIKVPPFVPWVHHHNHDDHSGSSHNHNHNHDHSHHQTNRPGDGGEDRREIEATLQDEDQNNFNPTENAYLPSTPSPRPDLKPQYIPSSPNPLLRGLFPSSTVRPQLTLGNNNPYLPEASNNVPFRGDLNSLVDLISAKDLVNIEDINAI